MVQIKTYATNVKVHGLPIKIIEGYDKEGIDIDTITEKYSELVEKLKDKDFEGEIALSLFFPSKNGGPGQWRYVTKFLDIEVADFFVDNELLDYYGRHQYLDWPDKFKMFQIQIINEKNVEEDDGDEGGGKDPYNDCFYNVLEQLVPQELKQAFPAPESLKEHLKIGRHAYIKISHIAEIESKLKDVRINVLNDEYTDSDVYLFQSKKVATKTVTMRLDDNHYMIDKKQLNDCKGVCEYEKPFVVFRYIPQDPKNVEIFDGKQSRIITFELLKNWQRNFRYSGKYLCVPFKESKTVHTLKECWHKFKVEADLLKEFTKGKYNLFKCGTINKCIMSRFIELNKTLVPDAIGKKEAAWLKDCHGGGLVWSEKGYQGPGYKYDINSFYGSILQSHLFSFPIRAGTFKTITKEAFENMEYFPFGIYRAQVTDYDKQLFSVKTKLTHWDLQEAKKHGYKIKLICDGKENFLDYSGVGMRASGLVFREIIEELYAIKKILGKFGLIKELLTHLWGVLSERKKTKKFINKSTDEFEVPKNMKVDSMKQIHDNWSITLLDKDHSYETGFARLAPFLTSKCRVLMSRLIEPHKDKIVRVYVDGLICKELIDFKSAGDEIGMIRLDGFYPNCKIINSIKVEGNDLFKQKINL